MIIIAISLVGQADILWHNTWMVLFAIWYRGQLTLGQNYLFV